MFDIGIMEVMVILIVALIIIGPERMPEVARNLGKWIGKARRFMNSMKENNELTNTVRDMKSEFNNVANIETETKNLKEKLNVDLKKDLKEDREMEGFFNSLGTDKTLTSKDNDLSKTDNKIQNKSQLNKDPEQSKFDNKQDNTIDNSTKKLDDDKTTTT